MVSVYGSELFSNKIGIRAGLDVLILCDCKVIKIFRKAAYGEHIDYRSMGARSKRRIF